MSAPIDPLMVIFVVAVLILGIASLAWGADSRPAPGGEHRG